MKEETAFNPTTNYATKTRRKHKPIRKDKKKKKRKNKKKTTTAGDWWGGGYSAPEPAGE